MSARMLVVHRRPPYGTSHAQDAMEAVLASAALGVEVAVAFVDDGVWQIVAGQHPGDTGLKDFVPAFRLLPELDVGPTWVERESLQRRGIGARQLLLPAQVIGARALARRLDLYPVVIEL